MAELKRCPCLLPVIVFILMSCGRPGLVRAQPALEIRPEPGFVADDGTWVLPYTALNAAAPVGDGGVELIALRDGRQLLINEQLSYALATDQGQMTALMVLLDLPPLPENIRGVWSADLVTLLNREARPGVWASLARCGSEDSVAPLSGKMELSTEAAAELLQALPSSRLWDSVIAALGVLTAPELPERRVLLLISDGREEIASRHVMTSCVEAALRARVAVYVLSLADGAEAEGARLGDLARRTGGRLLTAGQPRTQDLAEILAWIGAARGLRLEAEGTGLPAEITLQVRGDARVRAVGMVAHRQVSRGSGGARWLLVTGALLAAGGAGYLLWRQRAVMVGDLMIRTKSGVRRFPIPRHGVTIGRDEENSMVLNSRLVSRHHAVIRVKGGRVIITDLRSSGGTTVNGEAIGTCQLQPGDRIMIGGSVELVFAGLPTAT